MKISTKGRYALRMMLDLAEHREQGFVSLKEIAARQDISKKYLEQIVAVLNRPDFLKTNRGYQGGYRLAKTPDQYTVGDILRLTEGGLAPVAWRRSRIPAPAPLPALRCRCGPGCIKPSIPTWTALPCKTCWSRSTKMTITPM